jgi:hypothetical protein
MGRKRAVSINELRARAAQYNLESTGTKKELEERLIGIGLGLSDFEARKEDILSSMQLAEDSVERYHKEPLLIIDVGSYRTNIGLVHKGNLKTKSFRSLIGSVKKGTQIANSESGKVYGDDVIKNVLKIKNPISASESWAYDWKIKQDLVLYGLKSFEGLDKLEVKLVMLTGGDQIDKTLAEAWARQYEKDMPCKVLDVLYMDSTYAAAYGTNQKSSTLHIEGGYSQTGITVVTGSHEPDDIFIINTRCGGKDYNSIFQEMLPKFPSNLITYLVQAWLLSEYNVTEEFLGEKIDDFPIKFMKRCGVTIKEEDICIKRGREEIIKEGVEDALKETFRQQARVISYATEHLIERLPYSWMNHALANVYTGGSFLFNSKLREYIEEELDLRGYDCTSIYHVNNHQRAFRGVVNILESVT